jgi:hypothetical protein
LPVNAGVLSDAIHRTTSAVVRTLALPRHQLPRLPSGHQVIMDVISSIVIVIVYVVCLVNPIGITPVGIVPLFFSVAFCMSLVFGHRARTNNRKFYLPVGSIYQE